jgi:hypothetical protein
MDKMNSLLQTIKQEEVSLPGRKVGPFVLFWSSTDWMRPPTSVLEKAICFI